MVGQPLKKYQKKILKKREEKRMDKMFQMVDDTALKTSGDCVVLAVKKPLKSQSGGESVQDFLKKLTQSIKGQATTTTASLAKMDTQTQSLEVTQIPIEANTVRLNNSNRIAATDDEPNNDAKGSSKDLPLDIWSALTRIDFTALAHTTNNNNISSGGDSGVCSVSELPINQGYSKQTESSARKIKSKDKPDAECVISKHSHEIKTRLSGTKGGFLHSNPEDLSRKIRKIPITITNTNIAVELEKSGIRLDSENRDPRLRPRVSRRKRRTSSRAISNETAMTKESPKLSPTVTNSKDTVETVKSLLAGSTGTRKSVDTDSIQRLQKASNTETKETKRFDEHSILQKPLPKDLDLELINQEVVDSTGGKTGKSLKNTDALWENAGTVSHNTGNFETKSKKESYFKETRQLIIPIVDCLRKEKCENVTARISTCETKAHDTDIIESESKTQSYSENTRRLTIPVVDCLLSSPFENESSPNTAQCFKVKTDKKIPLSNEENNEKEKEKNKKNTDTVTGDEHSSLRATNGM